MIQMQLKQLKDNQLHVHVHIRQQRADWFSKHSVQNTNIPIYAQSLGSGIGAEFNQRRRR